MNLKAQKYQLIVSSTRTSESTEKRYSFNDSSEVFLFLNKSQKKLHKEGYLLANFDSTVFSQDTIKAFLYQGPKLNINQVIIENYQGGRKKFDYNGYQKFIKNLLENSENNGYPFAKISTKAVKRKENNINLILNLEKGPKFYFDSIIVHEGKNIFTPSFLTNYLNIQPGTIFSQEKLEAALLRLKNLPYIKNLKSNVHFVHQKCRLHLSFKKRPANSIDGLIGILPNENNRSILLTGNVDLDLKNLFRSGKNISFHWKKIKFQSQTLDFQYSHPDLLGTNINALYNNKMLKEDTSFFNIKHNIKLGYETQKAGVIQLLISRNSTRTLGKSSSEVFGGNSALFGFGWRYQKTDDPIYTKRGIKLELEAKAGNKSTNENTNLSDEINSKISPTSVLFESELNLKQWIQVGKKTCFYNQLIFYHLENNSLGFNDLYRTGGLSSIRGFNQNFFFVNSMLAAQFEYKFYIDETSDIYLFTDHAFLQSKTVQYSENNYASGYGVGFSFLNNRNRFNFSYAVGVDKNTKLDFRLSKIHFGFVNSF